MEESHSEVVMDELMELMRTRGRLRYEEMERVRKDTTHKDTMPLDDELKEMIEVWRTGNEGEEENKKTPNALAENKDVREARGNFVSHIYINNRWGLFKNTKGKIEEWWIPDPPVLNEDDEEYLCDMCRHIDFKVIFSQRGIKGSKKSEKTSIHFEQLHPIFERESCAFCGLLARQIRADHDMSQFTPEQLRMCDFYLETLDEGPEAGLMLEVQYQLSVHQDEPYRFIIHWVNFASESGKMTPFHGLAICPTSVTFEACKTWLVICDKLHPIIRHSGTESKESQLRLIDVEENCVSKVDLPCRYVCLSYVWGGIDQVTLNSTTKYTLEERNGLHSDSICLSKTITDAIIATRKLGIRYIWIDALCIQQDDEQDLSINISNMAAIYGNAVLTVVASTNSDPTQGLPGVSSTPRAKEANYAVVQGLLLTVAMHDYRKPLIDLNKTVWNTRAWTFQERHLSQRLLFFTESETVFVCPHSVMFEDTQPMPQPYFESKEIASTIKNICMKWLTEVSRDEFIRKHKDTLEPDMLQRAMDSSIGLREVLNFRQLYQMDYQERGWKVLVEKRRNQHIYVHERYPGVLLDYPIPLPDEELLNHVCQDDTLQFLAYSASVRFCNMSELPFVQKPGQEAYLQLGLEDESRSANDRPSWQRIIYHQGYRAGFLMLNIPFDEIDLHSLSYKLVALSRDTLSEIAPPKDPKLYFMLGPVELQYHLGLSEMPQRNVTAQVPPPKENATPVKTPNSENGDAWWDHGRFQHDVFPIYNVLLVRDLRRHAERIGVGKVHWTALHHAGAKEDLIILK
ncbi:HET-domain-containing protein [Aspergillus steynii IBT 23096]|uniref:HET-domain-containing protein n=1 Tax=Aspergillus steynii IBT 23096 TaxID=1392250 RepID=A0A2I2GB34_9EURO|nr:HET-domain-containing protein [Aspergillus steynii IBT 23096]PLB50091.1 HET-domain-containing protein [Aspergillus steynii IBT 23096]